MRVSIVICTLNRASSLRATLECLRFQTYDDFEVVVVNGPSTDGTDEVLRDFEHEIRIDNCPAPNLSMSRNIGIRASAGEIVAFIDDDALPEFDWLRQALPAFDEPEVAGVGGIVFDHTGMQLQYRYSAANRFGEATWSTNHPFDALCAPGAFTFPYLQGTNALFRRDVLEEVGGFDETYEYYLDETDVCCRIVDHGYVLRQLADAPVHHKFLPSGIRDHQRVVTNWYPIIKNNTYFAYRHALEDHGEQAVVERATAFLRARVDDARFHEDAGRLPAGSTRDAASVGERALREGAELGMARLHTRLGPVRWPVPEFMRFPGGRPLSRRRYALVSSGYGENMTGGVARYTTDLARELIRQNVEVRVITSAPSHSTVDLEDGVWVHRLAPEHAGVAGIEPATSDSINDFATAVLHEVQRIESWAPIDIVYGALWDVEQLGVVRRTGIPTMVHLVTPAAVAAREAGFADDPGSREFVEHLIGLERELIQTADLLHANGNPIVDTLSRLYPGAIDQVRCQVVPLGLVDSGGMTPRGTGGSSTLDVLFVGRLESRKGIDLFLDTVRELAPAMPGVHWTVVGADGPLRPGEAPVGAAFRERHRASEWLRRVEFTGPIDDAALHEHYASCDLAVLPSRYESFGLVMVEAMMHGRALVSSDVGGIVEVVRNGVDGVLVPPGDGPALTNAVRDLLRDPERRAALGEAGRERFRSFFAMAPATTRFIAAAERLRRHSAVGGPATPAGPWTPGPASSADLCTGASIQLDVADTSSWRVAVEALEPTVAVVEPPHGPSTTCRIDRGSVQRWDLVPGRSVMRVAGGALRVHGLTELREPTAP